MMMGNPYSNFAPAIPPTPTYYDPYMTSFINKPEWVMSSYWGRSAFPYPNPAILYASATEPPANRWDLLHPYYRTRVAKYVVPAIVVAGAGFIAYTTWYTYFRDATPFDGKWDDKSRKDSVKKLWTNMQGGFLGAVAFGTFITLLVSLQLWMKGKSLPKTIKYFGEMAQDTSGVSRLTENI